MTSKSIVLFSAFRACWLGAAPTLPRMFSLEPQRFQATNVRLISIATPRSSKSTTFGLAFCLRCSFELRRGWDEHAACLMRFRKDFSSAVSAIPGKLMGGDTHTHICTHRHSYPATALTHTRTHKSTNPWQFHLGFVNNHELFPSLSNSVHSSSWTIYLHQYMIEAWFWSLTPLHEFYILNLNTYETYSVCHITSYLLRKMQCPSNKLLNCRRLSMR